MWKSSRAPLCPAFRVVLASEPRHCGIAEPQVFQALAELQNFPSVASFFEEEFPACQALAHVCDYAYGNYVVSAVMRFAPAARLDVRLRDTGESFMTDLVACSRHRDGNHSVNAWLSLTRDGEAVDRAAVLLQRRAGGREALPEKFVKKSLAAARARLASDASAGS